MKIHFVTIGKPKLHYAHMGWNEYMLRLIKFHDIHVTHLADKYAGDSKKILQTAGKSFKVAMVIDGKEVDSPQLAKLLHKFEQKGKEISFIVGGPEGLPKEVIKHCDYELSLSQLTFPHDLAMIVMLEALYRASTINAGLPYHK